MKHAQHYANIAKGILNVKECARYAFCCLVDEPTTTGTIFKTRKK